jgi:predicted lipid-binding transport protein (Tim44 family)
MKFWMIGPLVAGLLLSTLAPDAEARRFGGGKSLGMQRAAPVKPATPPPTSANAQTTPSAAANNPAAAPTNAAAAATPGRSWLAPVAGLAAGLGLAALASHLGFGEGLANFMMLALLAIAVVVAVRLLARRFAGAAVAPRPAYAGMADGAHDPGAPMARQALPSVAVGSALATPIPVPGDSAAAGRSKVLPADFDREGFERIAKMIFIRMQAAHDSADLNDLRNFTTPELFAAIRLDLHERGPAAQQTDVEHVEAQVLDFALEDERQIVSVRFQGRIRETADGQSEPFDEVWHLVRPVDGTSSWAIAGIQQ